jgi:(1->4)-alpha-D-glucan 1-alpha-D-glucosylmutase
LHLRREHPDWFGATSAYLPMAVEGPEQDHLVAYLRGENVAVIAPRWNSSSAGISVQRRYRFPRGPGINLLTGESFAGGSLRAQNLFKRFPVALLAKNGE